MSTQPTFVETNCTIEHEGHSFTSGGAFLCDCTDGYRRGVVYVKPSTGHGELHRVTTWHGDTIAVAGLGPVYRGNFCRMRAVSFVLDGVRYTGRYCPDWAEMVRVRSTKRVSLDSHAQ